MRTISQMREMFSVAPLLNQQMPRRCFVTSERGWFCQILAEPSFQFVQFFGVGAGGVSPLQGSCCCLKDSLLHLTILVLAADDETDVFAFFQWIVPLEDETFVVGLDESEASGKAGKHGAQAATDDLFESFDKREFCVVKRGILGDSKDDVGERRFCNSSVMLSTQSLWLGIGTRYLGGEGGDGVESRGSGSCRGAAVEVASP